MAGSTEAPSRLAASYNKRIEFAALQKSGFELSCTEIPAVTKTILFLRKRPVI